MLALIKLKRLVLKFQNKNKTWIYQRIKLNKNKTWIYQKIKSNKNKTWIYQKIKLKNMNKIFRKNINF